MAKSSSVSPARLAAFEILLRVEAGAYASILLSSRENDLSPLDRALTHELVMGVLRRQLWLDRLAEIYTRRKTSDLDVAIRVILRLGLYQLRFLDRIPESAAVNESVNLVKVARLRSAGGMVNAVLRRATREREIDPTKGIKDPIERIAVETSHPHWLIERWCNSFGEVEAEKFAADNNETPPTAFRVVNTKAQESRVLEQLEAAGGSLERSEIANSAWRIVGAGGVLAELAANGAVYIQDEASQLVAEVLNARSGNTVLDLCAAPGSKTTQIAGDPGNAVTVVAADLHTHRLQTLMTSSKLQGLTNIRPINLDALRRLPFVEKAFDRVLVDAPCSGTGTLRRNPEIRWRISPGDIVDLSNRQKVILENAAVALKPGGRLVYSTCSVEPQENEAIRQSFLENNKSFHPVDLEVKSSLVTSQGIARTWPHRDGTDGFFICAFERLTD